MRYEAQWDEEKNRRNQKEKGLAFEDCLGVFDDPNGLFEEQEREGEIRFKLTGKAEGEILTVVFTWRKTSRRIISAWPASRQERRVYLER